MPLKKEIFKTRNKVFLWPKKLLNNEWKMNSKEELKAEELKSPEREYYFSKLKKRSLTFSASLSTHRRSTWKYYQRHSQLQTFIFDKLNIFY